MVDLIERLDILLTQEDEVYQTVNYLDPEHQTRLVSTLVGGACDVLESSSLSSTTSSGAGSSSAAGINEYWREKIVEWSYQVIDHFDFSREVVGVSIHYLDRFLATRHVSKKMFQLAAMTTLFLAVKLYEPGRISMASMIELSRGYFLEDQMKAMELEVLSALGWRVHPPTAYCFSKHILFLMPYKSISMDARHNILELARFLTELSVIDYFFVAKKPSSVALAALQNSMNEIPDVSLQAQKDFAEELERVSGLDLHNPEVVECRERLRLLYAQGSYARPETRTETPRVETISPVCVSFGVSAQCVSYGLTTNSTTHPQGQPVAKANNASTEAADTSSSANTT